MDPHTSETGSTTPVYTTTTRERALWTATNGISRRASTPDILARFTVWVGSIAFSIWAIITIGHLVATWVSR